MDRLFVGCLVTVVVLAEAKGADVMMLAIVFSKLDFLKEDLRRALDEDVLLLLTDSFSVAPAAAATLHWLEGELVVDEAELTTTF